MDDNMNPNVPGSTPGAGSDPAGQGQMPNAGVPGQQPDPMQPPVGQPQAPVSEPPAPQPEQPTSNDQGQTNPGPAVGA